MSNVRVDTNYRALGVLLKSREVETDLLARAQRIATEAGEGFVAKSMIGHTRAIAWVVTDTPRAMVVEARDRVLSAAIQAGA